MSLLFNYNLVLLLQLKGKLRVHTILETVEKLFVGKLHPSQITLPPSGTQAGKTKFKSIKEIHTCQTKEKG